VVYREHMAGDLSSVYGQFLVSVRRAMTHRESRLWSSVQDSLTGHK